MHSVGCSVSWDAQVEIQNYIDDTGVQVADVAVGFRELEHKTLDEVRAIADAGKFDYYCWDLVRASDRVVRRLTPSG